MADAAKTAPPPPRRGAMPLITGVALACALGAGAFGVIYTGLADGLIPARGGAEADSAQTGAFLEIAPIMVSLGGAAEGRVLRFAVTLEVAPGHEAEVARLMPRLLDMLNSYLRALEPEDFAAPGALLRIRAQLLRRMQVVAGEGRIRDLLVTEFLMN